MRRRHKLSKGVSKKHFRNNAGSHPKNIPKNPMRGGFRL
ncbi:MAG: hypothetical protein [Microvirus sp.]|nr:MAG: hypothetical protein [Microvirus sp.]